MSKDIFPSLTATTGLNHQKYRRKMIKQIKWLHMFCRGFMRRGVYVTRLFMHRKRFGPQNRFCSLTRSFMPWIGAFARSSTGSISFAVSGWKDLWLGEYIIRRHWWRFLTGVLGIFFCAFFIVGEGRSACHDQFGILIIITLNSTIVKEILKTIMRG